MSGCCPGTIPAAVVRCGHCVAGRPGCHREAEGPAEVAPTGRRFPARGCSPPGGCRLRVPVPAGGTLRPRPVGGWVRSFPRRPSSRRRGSPWSGGGTGRRRGGRPSSRGTRARWGSGRSRRGGGGADCSPGLPGRRSRLASGLPAASGRRRCRASSRLSSSDSEPAASSSDFGFFRSGDRFPPSRVASSFSSRARCLTIRTMPTRTVAAVVPAMMGKLLMRESRWPVLSTGMSLPSGRPDAVKTTSGTATPAPAAAAPSVRTGFCAVRE